MTETKEKCERICEYSYHRRNTKNGATEVKKRWVKGNTGMTDWIYLNCGLLIIGMDQTKLGFDLSIMCIMICFVFRVSVTN